MWAARADPYVIRARALPRPGSAGSIDLTHVALWDREHDGRRHIRIDLSGGAIRLDPAEGEITAEALWIEPAIDLLRPLEPQFASIRRLHAFCRNEIKLVRHQRFVRLVEALRANDALAAGASLRDIALGTLGGDWPGDGEHLKSRVRRRVALAADLKRAGPGGVLAERI